MVRSVVAVPANTRRRKSKRLSQQQQQEEQQQQMQSTSAPSASSNQQDNSQKVSARSASQDAPYRNLRRRSSMSRSESQNASEAKQRPAALSTTSITATTETTATRSNPKRRKRSEDLFEAPPTRLSGKKGKTPNAPLTRSKRHASVNQVTPSPTSNPASPAFTFNSPDAKKQRRSFVFNTPKVPLGVVDLYPETPSETHTVSPASCPFDTCSATSLNADFIRSYGKEYWQYMKEHEEAIVPASDVTSSRGSRSSRSAASRRSQSILQSPTSSSGSSALSSLLSHQTPDHRRDWVHIDTSTIVPVKPVESTKFLDYQPELTPKMRCILVDWIIELSEHFYFSPRTLHLAVTLIDKVLSCGPLGADEEDADDNVWDADDGSQSKTNCFLISRDRFQLLGATCTWLACKMEEQKPPEISEIAYVSDNIYTVDQIKRMERRICKALNFALIHQTPFPYIYEFMRASTECTNAACPTPPLFHNMVLYLLELGRLPYMPVTQKPSLLAAAAVYLARVTLGVGEAWTPTLAYYTGYEREDLKETVLAIHSYHLAAEDSSLKSVFTKYKAKKYHRVALKTVALQENLGF